MLNKTRTFLQDRGGDIVAGLGIIGTVICFSLVLTGCGQISRNVAHAFGHASVCVDGVTYLQFPSGATVKYDRAGKVVPCN